MRCKFYLSSPNNTDNRCLNPHSRFKKCHFVECPMECESFERYTEEKGNTLSMKLELVQYPYSKSGRPTIYLDDWLIAGPRAFGVGKTVASYELTEENLKDIQKIVTRELNRMNGIE